MKLSASCLHWYQIQSFIFAFLTSNEVLTWALFDRTMTKKKEFGICKKIEKFVITKQAKFFV